MKNRYRSFTADEKSPKSKKSLESLISVPEKVEFEIDQYEQSDKPVKEVEVETIFTLPMLKAHLKKTGLLNDNDHSGIVLQDVFDDMQTSPKLKDNKQYLAECVK